MAFSFLSKIRSFVTILMKAHGDCKEVVCDIFKNGYEIL